MCIELINEETRKTDFPQTDRKNWLYIYEKNQ